MTEKTLTTDNIKPAIDALRGELAPWPIVAMKQDRLNDTQKSAVNSGITSGLVAQIIANTAAIRALESAITGTGLRPLVVASLPAIGTQGILYIVPVTTYDPSTDADVVNYSNEYIWIVAPDAPVTQGYYEQVGQTGIVINDGTLTVKANNVSLGTFTANQSGNTDINITIPTNSDYVDLTTAQTAAGVKTFSDGIVGNVTGTASRAIADADGNTISSTYGKLAGNQTWTGTNTFRNINPETNSTYSLGTSSLKWSNVYSDNFYSTNNYTIVAYTRNAGDQPTVTAFIREFKVDSADSKSFSRYTTTVDQTYTNTQLITTMYDSNGDVDNEMRVRMQVSASDKIFIPGTNGDIKLGTSSNRWSSVYANSYYYGTTAWGLDKANTWTQTNRYTGSIELQYTQSGSYSDIRWVDELDATIACFRNQSDNLTLGKRYTGKTAWYNGAQFSLLSNGLAVIKGYDGTNNSSVVLSGNAFYPDTANINLGLASKKWVTFNGVNPGALSLPESAGIEVDRTNWVYDGVTSNKYTPTVDGWLQVRCADASGNFIFVASDGKVMSTSGTGVITSVVFGLNVLMPVRASKECDIRINCSGSKTAYFYPCLGNV